MAHSISRRDSCGSIKGTGSHGLEGTNFCLGSSKISLSSRVLSSFIPDFSKIAKPMTSLLQKDHKFTWTEGCEVAFRTLRKLLTTAPVLAQPNIEKPFDVFCDA